MSFYKHGVCDGTFPQISLTHGETEAHFRCLGQLTAKPFCSLGIFCAQLSASLCYKARAWSQTQKSLFFEPGLLFPWFPAHICLGRVIGYTAATPGRTALYCAFRPLTPGTVVESIPGASMHCVPGSCAPSSGILPRHPKL